MLGSEALELVTAPLELGKLLSLGEGLGHGLAIELGQFRLVIEGLEVGRAARHAEVNDPLGLGWEMEFFVKDAFPAGSSLGILAEEVSEGGTANRVG